LTVAVTASAGLSAVAAALALALPAGTAPGGFRLTSPAFRAGGTIPVRYTCSGRNISPPLRWSAPRRRTRAFGIAMVDLDAHFRHWLAWGIGARARGLPAGMRPPHEAVNDFGQRGYGGPCPP